MTIEATSVIKKLLLIFLIVAALYIGEDFLMPITIAIILATLLLPVSRRLEKWKIPKVLAAIICVMLMVSFFAVFFALLGWQVSLLADDLPKIQEKGGAFFTSAQQFIHDNFYISLHEQKEMLKNQQDIITGFISSLAGSLSSIFTNSIMIFIYAALLLFYRSHIKEFLLKLAPQHQRKEMEDMIFHSANVTQQYLIGLAKMIVCLWVMYGIGFSLLGVKNAIFFAILCGVLEIVPFIGNITGTTITVLVAAMDGGSLSMLGGIVATYGVVQLIQGWLLEPLIVGPQVKINPLFTILALVVGELIWGIPGIIVAIPLIAMLKVFCDHIDALKPYGFLIAEVESKPKEPNAIIAKIKTWLKTKP
jgi:predicted PurR-regulated permease PerM